MDQCNTTRRHGGHKPGLAFTPDRCRYLRLPLTESATAIEKAGKRPAGQEVTVGPPEELTWRAAVPYSLMFLGAGLAAKGSLRSEKQETKAGVLMIIAGWLLYSQTERDQ